MKYLTDSFEINKKVFELDFKDCSDFLIREVSLGKNRGFFCVMDGLCDTLLLAKTVTTPILKSNITAKSGSEYLDRIKKCVVGSVEINEADNFEDLYFYLMSGFAVFVVENSLRALVFGVQGWNKRTTEEPSNEAMVKGAKECFVESLNDNKAMLRRRLKTPDLKLKQIKLGESVSSGVVIAYVKSEVKEGLVSGVEKKLNELGADAVLDYGCIAEWLKCRINSPFTTVGNTERPDVFASKLLEGRIGIIVDGTPFALYLPYLFSDNFSSLDDYDNPAFYSSFIRILKLFSFIISLFLPAFYVAIGTFHQEMIPTNLLFLIATSEEATPFSLVAEGIIIHILYEIMREAGLRLPKTVGHAVSIIGAIVIGEAMVSAGIIGEPMLVVVALTAIASYAVYPLYESVAVIRIIFIVVAGFSGIYGLMLAGAVLGVNICSLSSLGVPYFAPVSPLTASSLKDTLIRANWNELGTKMKNIWTLRGVNNGE